MTSRPSALASMLVLAWTRAYTWGMHADRRKARLAEVESDLWESQHDHAGDAARWSQSLQIAARLVAGVPADVLWRLEQSSQGVKPMGRRIAAVIITVLSLLVVYVLVLPPPVEFPDPPAAPRDDLMSERPKGPPPPPPPPPTWDEFVRKVTTYGATNDARRR